MICRNLILILIGFACIGNSVGFLEVLAGLGSYLYYKLPCFGKRCCTKNEIPMNFNDLESNLEYKIFGQPLVRKTVISALKSHWNEQHKPDKALTLSFHGGPGVGKNYVSKFIQEALYKEGTKSPHVHYFMAVADFPEASQVQVYKRNLANWIRGNVTACPKQLFIFDEVNSMPPGVLDVIKSFIDYVDYINGVTYKEAIFIFLSNTGTKAVNEQVYYLWKNGIDRDALKLSDFEKLITQGAFNEQGGFYRSDTIKANLIDHYIPFLPMMKPHIRMCILEEFRKRGIPYPAESDIEEVFQFIDWAPDDDKIFSKTGCKRISQKVGLLAY